MKCVSKGNQQCQSKSTIIEIYSNEPLYSPFTLSVNNCSGSCNAIGDPYARVCVPNKVKIWM